MNSKKTQKAMKGHGVAKSGETECTRINLKNIGPTFFSSLCQFVIILP